MNEKQIKEAIDCGRKIKRKKIVVTENGYNCATCEYETVTYESTVPKVCASCGEPTPKLKWRNIIHHDLVIETIKL